MKILNRNSRDQEGSAMMGYLFVALVTMATIAAIAGLVVQNLNYSQRRQDLVNALQYAQGGAAIAASDVEKAFTNASGVFVTNLTLLTYPYVQDNSLSSASQWVYTRTITNIFTNQSVTVRLWMTNSPIPYKVKILSTATVNLSSQTSQMNLELGFYMGAAIISTAQGDNQNSASKSVAQAGDVVIIGNKGYPNMIDGGIVANGAVNTNVCTVDNYAEGLYSTASQLPDYTNPGSTNQLFDFNRFIAVADATGNHYTNVASFISACNGPSSSGTTSGHTHKKAPPIPPSPPTVLNGVVVVDIPYSDKSATLSPTTLPKGINVDGTLMFNFKDDKSGSWKTTDKLVNTADVNINPVDLSKIVATDPTTYISAYPPHYLGSKDPSKVDISPYQNFQANDDLPALMYNNAILDLHGAVNISGVVYSPCFMEIENKQDGQIQYFRGALIGGGGVYVENNTKSTNIVSADPTTLDQLATLGSRGKNVKVVYCK